MLWAPAARLSAPWCMLHIGMSSRHAAYGLHTRRVRTQRLCSQRPKSGAVCSRLQLLITAAAHTSTCSTLAPGHIPAPAAVFMVVMPVGGRRPGQPHFVVEGASWASTPALTQTTANGLMWNSLPVPYASSMRLSPRCSLRPACRGPGRPEATDNIVRVWGSILSLVLLAKHNVAT